MPAQEAHNLALREWDARRRELGRLRKLTRCHELAGLGQELLRCQELWRRMLIMLIMLQLRELPLELVDVGQVPLFR